mmetsp:Transcript_19702/g.62470  ORF Transcript_19702/g.62470 Transcript_19702/m.62470 type:complete len:213 (-) Transcript_19702:474-1112(-)
MAGSWNSSSACSRPSQQSASLSSRLGRLPGSTPPTIHRPRPTAPRGLASPWTCPRRWRRRGLGHPLRGAQRRRRGLAALQPSRPRARSRRAKGVHATSQALAGTSKEAGRKGGRQDLGARALPRLAPQGALTRGPTRSGLLALQTPSLTLWHRTPSRTIGHRTRRCRCARVSPSGPWRRSSTSSSRGARRWSSSAAAATAGTDSTPSRTMER